MLIKRVHHIGILAPSTQSKIKYLLDMLLGAQYYSGYVPEFKANCYMYEIGSVGVELVVPSDDSKLWNRLSETGNHPSLHHIAFEVDNLHSFKSALSGWISEHDIRGIGVMLVNFIHPLEYGIMLEFVELIDET